MKTPTKTTAVPVTILPNDVNIDIKLDSADSLSGSATYSYVDPTTGFDYCTSISINGRGGYEVKYFISMYEDDAVEVVPQDKALPYALAFLEEKVNRDRVEAADDVNEKRELLFIHENYTEEVFYVFIALQSNPDLEYEGTYADACSIVRNKYETIASWRL